MNFLKKLFSRRNASGDVDDQLYNPELQQAIEAVTQNNTSATRKALYEVLLTLVYCIATSGQSEGNMATILLTQNEQGQLVLPAFSDPNALRRWGSNPESMLVITADKMFEMAIENDWEEILINPAGPAGGKLTREQYTKLSQGIFPD